MQTYLSVIVADEYSLNKDYQKALTIYKRSLLNYERDAWTPIADGIKLKITNIEKRVQSQFSPPIAPTNRDPEALAMATNS